MSRTRRLYPQELAKLAGAQVNSASLKTTAWQPNVTVVVLTFNRLHLSRRCIESIYAHADYPFNLLVYDDGSEQETIDYLQDQLAARDKLTLIEPHPHIGWAAARNRAFSRASTDYVFSLDNDIVCQPGWLRETMACAVRHDADFVAPLRLNPGGSVWAFGAELVRSENDTVLEIARWFHDVPLSTIQSWLGERDMMTNFVPGGAALFSVAAFRECGGFDEGYGAGFEDLDFSLKLAKRGYRVWATPRAVLTHDNEWLPQTDADVRYARARYDNEALRRAADLFHARWGVEVLPAKYKVSIQERLDRKLSHER